MSATRAFDLAQLAPETPANPNDGVLINTVGPPYATKFAPVVTGGKPGVTVGSSVPAATAANQILISGAGPNFNWAVGTNPASSATTPPPTAQFQVMMSDAAPSWQVTTAVQMVLQGGGAPIASPAFTGTPVSPTPPSVDNSTRIATTAFVIDALAFATGIKVFCEALTVTGGGVIPNLTKTPAGPVLLVLAGVAFLPVGTQPPFSVSGKTISWLSTLYVLSPGAEVAVWYPYAP